MDQKPKCGFDEKEDCTEACKWYDTCTRNPIWLKKGEQSESDGSGILDEDLGK